jgi:hypothetical protein
VGVVSTAGAAGGPDPAEPSADGPANALQRLIHARLRDHGWSYGVVARRGSLPRSTVYNLATTENLARPPRPDTLEKLARGLELPLSAVRSAAAEASGMHLYQSDPVDDETSVIIASLVELTPADRRVVAGLIESLRTRAAAAGQTPASPSGDAEQQQS